MGTRRSPAKEFLGHMPPRPRYGPFKLGTPFQVKVPTEKVFSGFSVFRSFSVFGEKLQPKKTEKSKRKMSKIEYFSNLFMPNLPKKYPKFFQNLSSITKWPTKWHPTGKLKLSEVSCSFLQQFFEKKFGVLSQNMGIFIPNCLFGFFRFFGRKFQFLFGFRSKNKNPKIWNL